MAIPDCPVITIGSQGADITFPGGAKIPVMVPEINPNDLQITKALLGQASGALAPLVPIFNLIDAMLAVKDFAEAVPGLITDPGALTSAITSLIEKITALASLIPQLSVPLMILDLIDVTITALGGVITQLEAVLIQEAKIAAAATAATQPGNESLLTVVACAEGINVQTKNGIGEGLGPLNSFFGLMNIFLGLIGLPPIPDLSGDLPDDTQEAIDDLKDVVKLLEDLRATIPIP